MLNINLQATIGGMSANSTTGGETVYGALDIPTGILLIDMSRAQPAGAPELRHQDCAVVTNNSQCEDYDALFTEKDMRDAIADYFAFAGRGLLELSSSEQRHNPSMKVAPDGVDESGVKYRVSPDITNGQVAVMVLCWFALRQVGFSRQLAAFDESIDTTVLTVGLPGMTPNVPGAVRYEMGGKLPIGRDGWPL